MLDTLFPTGVTQYALGGVLIGVGVAVVYLGTGINTGASTFLESTLSYVSEKERFNQHRYRTSRDWRVVFVLSMIAGAAAWTVLVAGETFVTDVQWWRLLAGGVLVGVGTRIGKGCTSGHGVCGVGSRSPTSIVNVATFMAFAIATALAVQTLGVTP